MDFGELNRSSGGSLGSSVEYPAFQRGGARPPIHGRDPALDNSSGSSHRKHAGSDLSVFDSRGDEHGVRCFGSLDCSPSLEVEILVRRWFHHGPGLPTYVGGLLQDVSRTTNSPIQRPCSSPTSNMYNSVTNPSAVPIRTWI